MKFSDIGNRVTKVIGIQKTDQITAYYLLKFVENLLHSKMFSLENNLIEKLRKPKKLYLKSFMTEKMFIEK